MSEADISGGILRVQQGKTKAKLRIVIDGELKVLLDEIAAYKTAQTPKSKVRVLALLVNEKGERLTAAMLRNRSTTRVMQLCGRSVGTVATHLSTRMPALQTDIPCRPDAATGDRTGHCVDGWTAVVAADLGWIYARYLASRF
ncbi:hypothetical protein [Piscinibacter sp.]|uniref:hypothetical protein n=1 Tax=Piscinibacter sp. TaxID=1903157 RepID=UPI002C53C00F|nr:hypothetical protein [Albitalea sp.]HUG21566.1 hypothetical protein [Albitalea sp.]